MKKSSTRLLTIIGMMSALSFGLYALEIPTAFLFPAAPYLKIDFSDIPAVMTGIIGGPISGVMVLFIKNLLHFLLISKESAGVGEIANFFAGLAFTLPVIILYRKSGFKLSWVSLVIATLSVTITMFLVNYYIVFPIYGIPREGSIELLLTVFTPFNILRGILLSVALVLFFPRVSSLLKKSFV
mgnify:CR=1 FL=1